jgi:hypothetical protein
MRKARADEILAALETIAPGFADWAEQVQDAR